MKRWSLSEKNSIGKIDHPTNFVDLTLQFKEKQFFLNAEGETGTFPLACTLYKPVLITKLYYFTNLYCILTSTELRDVFGLPRVSPVSPVCLYVCTVYIYVCTVYVRSVAATVFELRT